MRQLARALTLVSAALSASALTAQNKVWVVDVLGAAGSDFTAVQPAIDAAADGDVVLVRDGAYASFIMTGRVVSIVADAGAIVTFNLDTQVSQVPAGHSLVLRGMNFSELTISDSPGRVWVEEAVLTGSPGLTVDNCADVVVVRCTMVGANGAYVTLVGGSPPEPGLRATNSNLYIERCTLFGGDGADEKDLDPYIVGFSSAPQAGSAALVAGGGSLWFLSSRAKGGDGGDAHTLVLSLPVCWDGGDGGPGLELTGAISTTTGSLLTGGQGGSGEDCLDILGGGTFPSDPGADGAAFELGGGASLVDLLGPTNALTANSPVRVSETLSIAVTTEPAALVGVGIDIDMNSLPFAPLFGPLHLSTSPPAILAGVADGSGAIGFGVLVPPLIPGFEGISFTAQGIACASGKCVLTPASRIMALDASL